MKRTINIIIIIIITGFIIIIIKLSKECFKKGFYEYSVIDGDLLRLPLIQPYELYSADIQNAENWNTSVIGRKGDYMAFEGLMNESPHVDSVGISDNLIFLYSSREIFTNGDVSSAWFYFNVEQKRGGYYLKRNLYLDFLKNNYSITSVNFYNPTDIYKKFRDDNYLPREWDYFLLNEKNACW